MLQVTPGGVEALVTRQSEQEQKEETDSVVLQVLEVLRCAYCGLVRYSSRQEAH